MKVSTRIKEVDDRLVIDIPKVIVRSGGLRSGDKLTINLRGNNLTIENVPLKLVAIEKMSKVFSEDVFSKTLTEEELFLAK